MSKNVFKISMFKSCEYCDNSFSGKKYLNTRVCFKHSSDCPKLSQGSYGATVLSKDTDESDSQTAQQQVCERTQETRNLTELEGMDSMNGNSTRRGANRRKAYAIDFKLETLDLLDTLKELKTKNSG